MAKHLCRRKAQLKEDPGGYAAKVSGARFLCERCGRAATKKKFLCAPVRLPPPKP